MKQKDLKETKIQEEKKSIRRSSLISPYGVGAIVPFGTNESVMIGALEYWHYPDDKTPFIIRDDRFCQRLGVKELRLPPVDKDDKYDINVVRALRFPSTYYCPKCGYVMEHAVVENSEEDLNAGNMYNENNPICPECRDRMQREGIKTGFPRMKPDRFVVVCPNGHITDFPVSRWVHNYGKQIHSCSNPKIYRKVAHSAGYGEDVWYTCKTCGATVAMVTAVGKGKLAKINYKCTGRRPWMGANTSEECNCDPKELMVVPKGSSNLFFPVVLSSIYLPLKDELVLDSKDLNLLKKNSENPKTFKQWAEFIKERLDNEVTVEDVIQAYHKAVGETDNVTKNEDFYRFQEYKSLSKSCGKDSIDSDFYSENHPISNYDEILHPYFKSVSQIHKLRETRAFVGFSRLEPSAEVDILKLKKQVALKDTTWLPAIQVFGEGIFLEFDSVALKEWASRDDVQERVSLIDKGFHDVTIWANEGKLKPEFVLLHTFSHLLINQLSYDCGYGSSSIREKIYCQKSEDEYPMCGILIYTASSDSEGSLGGLVKQGEPINLENTIIAAIKNAAWCASDPICMESKGQGMNSCNLAACHNCALLPETSCENMNCLLDRGLVVGTLDKPEIGFFHELLEL